ncbi:vesicle transport protein [Polychytrium aggregatum]|uniref:vesicle transport protein n=1 Tax=Polychytrium aggregatum TaxID=110093 RepID=UPI0022FE35CD|nr:vesicle transport protein [Polychytrium aggregatum]KAI9199262.1 vesicle transport protein [Polychytrium aggregatum]
MPSPAASALTPSMMQVNIRRLLLKCDEMVAGKTSDSLLDNERVRIESNIQYLQALLSQLQASSLSKLSSSRCDLDADRLLQHHGNTVDDTTIAKYRGRVQALADLMDDMKKITFIETHPHPPGEDSIEANLIVQHRRNHELEEREALLGECPQTGPNAASAALSVEPPSKVEGQLSSTATPARALPTAAPAAAASEFRNRRANNRSLLIPEATASAAKAKADPGSVQPDTKLVLQQQREEQEKLTDDLNTLAANLKENTLLFGEYLKRDEKVMNETAQALDANVVRIQAENKRLAEFSATSRSTFWLIFFVVIFVVVTFILTFGFMRIFRVVKY